MAPVRAYARRQPCVSWLKENRRLATRYEKRGVTFLAIVYLAQEQKDADEARKAVEREGRKALLLPGNVTDPAFCQSAVKQTLYAFGRLDIVVNNAAYQLHQREVDDICVSPGPVWTPLNVADKNHEEVAKHGQGIPMGRPAQPEEVAPAFVFFASEADSSYITGEVLTLLGGETTAA